MAHVEKETLKEKKARIKAEKTSEDMWLTDIKSVCSTKPGRRFVWKTLGQCKFMQNVGDVRREVTERNIGKQNVGLWMLAEILKADENIFSKMMTESKQGEYDV